MHLALAIVAIVAFVGFLGVFNPSSPGLRDALLTGSFALPSGTSAVSGGAIDTGFRDSNSVFPDGTEFLIEAPSLSRNCRTEKR